MRTHFVFILFLCTASVADDARIVTLKNTGKYSATVKTHYLMGGPVPIAFNVRVPQVQPATQDGVRYRSYETVTLGLDGMPVKTKFLLTGPDGKEQRPRVHPDLTKTSRFQQGTVAILDVRANGVASLRYDLQDYFSLEKPGKYKLILVRNAAAPTGLGTTIDRRNPLDSASFVVLKPKEVQQVDLKGAIRAPQALNRPAKTTKYSAHAKVVSVGIGEKDQRYIGVSRFGFGKESGRTLQRLFDRSAPYIYFRIPPDAAILDAKTDFKSQIWLSVGNKEARGIVVWNEIRQEQYWVFPLQAIRTFTNDISFGSNLSGAPLVPAVLAVRCSDQAAGPFKDQWKCFSSFDQLHELCRERDMEIEIRKRVAVELRKHGIDSKKPDRRKEDKE